MHMLPFLATVILLAVSAFVTWAAAPTPAAQAAAPDPNAPINPSAYPAAHGKIRIACVGDSITQGSGTTAPANASNAYPSMLQRMLGDRFEVRNFGISGTTLLQKGDNPYQQQRAFADSKSYNPDVVIIMLGTNDTKPQNWKFQDQFAADYQNLVSQYAVLDAKPRIFICTPPFVSGEGNFGINEPNVLLEIPIINALANTLHVGLIDNHSATKDKDVLFPDRVHPSNDGALVLANTVYATITGKAYAGPSPVVSAVAQPATPR